MHVAFMNDLTKHLFTFYNSLLKIQLNCDRDNMLISNTCSFQKMMLSNWKCVLIYSWTKRFLEDRLENSVKFAEVYP